MPTLSELRAAVIKTVQEPSITDSEIDAILNRGVLEIAGGATRGYDVPTLPGLPELSTDFEIDTVTTANHTSMPDIYQRDAWYGRNAKNEPLRRYESLIEFRNRTSFDLGKTGNVESFCVIGRTIHYSRIPSSPEIITIHGFRYPVPMEIDTDMPDGIPLHLQHRLLWNYACMEVFTDTEQDMSGPGYNIQKHMAGYSAALKDLHDVILKDQPESTLPIDGSQFINTFV
jgi:hypothetical protein